MSREDLLELKKEITIVEDFAEELDEQELKQLDELKKMFDNGFNKLSDDDKKWLNMEFFKWIELYINEVSCTANGCSGCAGGCDIEF
ncbi:hypothetical protein FHQ18_04875 [Deferribacter autotrophicus]|uniref:Uncharacterized protein n=1 Tax=Deferribacter autotrophicus TaxID=500465 RepID=A0A5A8F852_9BACT|nr:hypothetical protein [Deferribacter autotrophicus]KAA0258492.1 hypothetical protein FHQ18_04875 [Deferribacter autotrophicus]